MTLDLLLLFVALYCKVAVNNITNEEYSHKCMDTLNALFLHLCYDCATMCPSIKRTRTHSYSHKYTYKT